MKFSLFKGLDDVRPVCPDNPIPNNATMLGEMPEYLRGLYTLVDQLFGHLAQLKIDYETNEENPEKLSEIDTDGRNTWDRIQLLTGVYKYELADFLQIEQDTMITIGKGWIIWGSKPDETDPTADENCDCLACAVRKAVGGAGSAIGIICIPSSQKGKGRTGSSRAN